MSGPARPPMTPAEAQRGRAEFDILLAHIAGLIRRFEASGGDVAMRDDYLALHRLQARTLIQRQEYAVDEAPGVMPPGTSAPPGELH